MLRTASTRTISLKPLFKHIHNRHSSIATPHYYRKKSAQGRFRHRVSPWQTIPSHLPATSSVMNLQPFSTGPKKPNIPKINNTTLSRVGAAGTFAFLSLSKSKSIFAALKLTKFASLGSMLLSVGAYTTIYGFPFATGMVGLILVHESGHALMMRHHKIPFSPMVFVPFLGAAIASKKPIPNAYQDSLIALAGPALGSAGAGLVWGAGMLTGSQLCLALGDFGFMINLFNLIPVGMLDGGRIGNALSPYVGVAGVGIAGSMIGTGMVSNPLFYLITLAGGYQSGTRLWKDYKGIADTSLPPNFYRITQTQKMVIGGSYVGLIGILLSAMALNENYKKSPELLQYEQRVASSSIVDGDGIKNIYRDY